ncbi:N-acetylmuramoyl-L-alanine amidase [Psychrobacillus psychrotolerans]|uniref:N-acetylmuramoyl-L-alanine amidase n=1 Tax=Psychrobacillus psychrotolerans TaxID=126156 RepID=UPI003B02AA10
MRLLQNGSKIGNATVIVDIIGTKNPEIRPQTKMDPKKVTTHNTGNSGRGANAEMHNRYIHNLASYHPKDTTHVSWHLTVDDKFIYQHIPFDEAAYHCGDGWGSKSGNRTSIGIEICENPETNTHQAEENAIALTVMLLKEFNLNANDVLPHQHWSGKYCPRVILKRDCSFNLYRKRVENTFNKKGEVKPVTITKGIFRIKTGTFPNARAFADAIDKIKSDFGMVIYEAADTTSFNPNYRIYTGTFTTKEAADAIEAKIKAKYGWTTYLIDGTK